MVGEMDFKALREDKGFTREELAALAGVSEVNVEMWEAGMSLPRADIVLYLCSMFDLCVEKILHSLPKWVKEHGDEWVCEQSCGNCPNKGTIESIREQKEKSPREGQGVNARSAIAVLRSIRMTYNNLNGDAGDAVKMYMTLDGGRISEVVARAARVMEIDEIIAYLSSLDQSDGA